MTRYGTGRASQHIRRWYDRLKPYNYKVEYVKGESNKVADALPRLSLASEQVAIEDDVEGTVITRLTQQSVLTEAVLCQATKNDEELQKVKQYVEHNKWPKKAKVPPSLKPYYDVQHEHPMVSYCFEQIIALLFQQHYNVQCWNWDIKIILESLEPRESSETCIGFHGCQPLLSIW